MIGLARRRLPRRRNHGLEQRIPLTLTPFLLSLGLTLLIVWFAVAGQVLGAARLKPAAVLRYE